MRMWSGPRQTGLRRGVRLYRRSLGAHLRSTLEYEADFWILVAGSALTQLVGLAFLGAVFSRVPHVNGWTFAEVVLIYSVVVLSDAVGPLLFEGVWRLPWLVNKGELDYKLVRPYPVVLQVLSDDVGINGLGNLVTGGAMFGWALWRVDVAWTPALIIGGLGLFASGMAVKLSISLATNSSAFWLQSPHSIFAYAVHQIGDLARYPVSVYTFGVRLVLVVGLPFAFVGFFPASAVLGAGGGDAVRAGVGPTWLGWLTPLVAAYCVAVAALIFRSGLRRYESAGN
ncbi:ABC transporter permease [Solwaraspora sp. WMMB762]|uniref:ABC transporter permease n=1 Tax=Solwaraspora sp. WMMB762 TaxID=3404120 RepID=UPI003B933061